MPTPYQLRNGNWIDLEKIEFIDIDVAVGGKFVVEIRFVGGIKRVCLIGSEESAVAYSDEIAAAWAEATRPRESVTHLPPDPEWDSILLEKLKLLGVAPPTGGQKRPDEPPFTASVSSPLAPGDKPIAFMGSPDARPFIVKCDRCGRAMIGKQYLGDGCADPRCTGTFIEA